MALVQLSVVEQRLVAVRAVPAGARVGEVAASLGVSRQSVDAWTCAIWPPGSLALRIGRIGRGRARGRWPMWSRLLWWRCDGSPPGRAKRIWMEAAAPTTRVGGAVDADDQLGPDPARPGRGTEAETAARESYVS